MGQGIARGMQKAVQRVSDNIFRELETQVEFVGHDPMEPLDQALAKHVAKRESELDKVAARITEFRQKASGQLQQLMVLRNDIEATTILPTSVDHDAREETKFPNGGTQMNGSAPKRRR